MKFVRFQWQNQVQWGIVESDRIFSLVGDIYGDFDKGEELCGLKDVSPLAPTEPGMMIACAPGMRAAVSRVSSGVHE